MAREIIPRENGQYAYYPDGIEEFVEEVSKCLCEKYPNVDLLDLEFIFQRIFAFAMTMQKLIRNEV